VMDDIQKYTHLLSPRALRNAINLYLVVLWNTHVKAVPCKGMHTIKHFELYLRGYYFTFLAFKGKIYVGRVFLVIYFSRRILGHFLSHR